MASSENLPSLDSLGFLRPGLSDFWLSDLFSRETETFTRALQRSFEPALASPEPTPTPTPTASGLSAGSDPEPAATPKRQRALGVAAAAGGRVAKRKSRATKRSQTTFITADAANFRQMVQQVTGVKLGGGAGAAPFGAAAPIIKPEPQRGFGAAAVARFHGGGGGGGGGCPPTLDTSAALLLEQSQAAQAVAMTCPPPMMTSSFVGDAPGGFDFDAFQIFPTLESWKVM